MIAAPTGSETRLCLEGELTIYRAAELKEAILTALDQESLLELDLSGVTELDTAGVQLLMLARRTATASKSVRLLAPSSAVREVFELLHLDAYFGNSASEKRQ